MRRRSVLLQPYLRQGVHEAPKHSFHTGRFLRLIGFLIGMSNDCHPRSSFHLIHLALARSVTSLDFRSPCRTTIPMFPALCGSISQLHGEAQQCGLVVLTEHEHGGSATMFLIRG